MAYIIRHEYTLDDGQTIILERMDHGDGDIDYFLEIDGERHRAKRRILDR